MNEDNMNRLYAAARFGTLRDVKAAFEACSYNERKAYRYGTLRYAAQNIGPYALEIVEFLMEQHDRSGCPIDIDSDTLRDAAENRGPCAPQIVEFLMERGLSLDSHTLCWAAYNHGPYALKIVEFLIGRGLNPDSNTLNFAAVNPGPYAFEMMKLLMERGAKPNSYVLCQAAKNSGPCALEIVKFLMEHHDRSGCPIDIDSDTLRHAARNPGPCALEIVEFLIGRGLNPDSDTLYGVAGNHRPYALEMMKLLMERGAKPNSDVLCQAATNPGPCALEIVKLLIARGVDPHERDVFDCTAFLGALHYGNTDISDYLFSRNDFCLSDLMPRRQIIPMSDVESKTYITFREKAISRVSDLIDMKGRPYAQAVTANIERILKTKFPAEPTEEDIEALQPLIKKIASKDWVSDAQVSCGDFLGCDVER